MRVSVIGRTKRALIVIPIFLPIFLSFGVFAFGQDSANQPGGTATSPPTAATPSPPTAATPSPPTAATPSPPTAATPSPPTAATPSPPTAATPSPPTAATPSPPTAATPSPPTAATPSPPTAATLLSPPLAENQVVSIFQGQTVSIPLSPVDSTLTYSISTLPIHGDIAGVDTKVDLVPGGIAIYTPDANFIGDDSFEFIAQNRTTGDVIQSATAQVTINVKEPPIPVFGNNIAIRNALSFTIAIIAIVVITLVANRIIRKLRSLKYPGHKSSFLDMIRKQDMVPSLSVFQFLLWTYVLMFALISVYFVRIFGGVADPPQGPLPVYLLALTGISVTSPIVSSLISSYRFSSAPSFEYSSEEDSYEEGEAPPPPAKKPGLGEMLRLNDKPTLSRFQMFAWTWISIGIYLSVLFSTVGEISTNVWDLTVPDIDPTLVALMGLSQVAFLGLKTTGSTGIQISKIFPLLVKPRQTLNIFGKNFGEEKQSIWIGTERMITATDQEHLILWSDDRIDIKIPEDIPTGRYYQVMIVKGGAAKTAKDKIYVRPPPSTSGSTGPDATVTKPPSSPSTSGSTGPDATVTKPPSSPSTSGSTGPDATVTKPPS